MYAYKAVPPSTKNVEDLKLMIIAATELHGGCVARVAGRPWSAVTFVPSARRPGASQPVAQLEDNERDTARVYLLEDRAHRLLRCRPLEYNHRHRVRDHVVQHPLEEVVPALHPRRVGRRRRSPANGMLALSTRSPGLILGTGQGEITTDIEAHTERARAGRTVRR